MSLKSRLDPVSIVIPCRNRADFLPDLIRNLLGLNYFQYEIIIVDDGSTDNSKKLLSKIPVRTISLKRSIGSARARNIGIMNAKYDIIALTDSDCYVSKNWLRDLVPYLSQYDLVGGKVIFQDASEMKLNPIIKLEETIRRDSPINFLNTSNLLFRKRVWKNLGGFSDYRIEDLDFSWKALKQEYKLGFVPKGLVIHHGMRTPPHNIKKYFLYGKSYSNLAFLHNMNLSFKSEPIITRALFWNGIKIFLSSIFILLILLLLNIAISNNVLALVLTFPTLMLYGYAMVYLLKRIDLFYMMFKATIFFSIINFTIILQLKKK
jgi:GT2 family glycosyltransferase